MKSNLEDWKLYEKTNINSFIEIYIKKFNIKTVDAEYFNIIKPLELDKDISSSVLGEIENYVNTNVNFLKSLKNEESFKIKSYRLRVKNGFINYAKDINLNIEKINENKFDIIFKLYLICIAGKSIENQNFRKSSYIKYREYSFLRFTFLPVTLIIWLSISLLSGKAIKYLFFYSFIETNGFIYLLMLFLIVGFSYLTFKSLHNNLFSPLNSFFKKNRTIYLLHSILGGIGFCLGVISSSEQNYLLRKDYTSYNYLSDLDFLWEISSLKVILNTIPFAAFFIALFTLFALMPYTIADD